MRITVKAKYLHTSPKKIRYVVDVIRGMKATEAIDQLQFMSKHAAKPVLKLLHSAVSNALHNHEIEKENLFIKEVRADDGPTQYRWQPRAHGRATPLRRRSAHVTLALEEIMPTKTKEKVKKKEAKIDSASKKKDIPVVRSLDEVKAYPPEEEKKEPAAESKSLPQQQKEEKGVEIDDVRRKGKHRHMEHQEKREAAGKRGFIRRIFSRKSGT